MPLMRGTPKAVFWASSKKQVVLNCHVDWQNPWVNTLVKRVSEQWIIIVIIVGVGVVVKRMLSHFEKRMSKKPRVSRGLFTHARCQNRDYSNQTSGFFLFFPLSSKLRDSISWKSKGGQLVQQKAKNNQWTSQWGKLIFFFFSYVTYDTTK